MRTFVHLIGGSALCLGFALTMHAPAYASSVTFDGCTPGTDYRNTHYFAYCVDIDAAKADLQRRYPGAEIGVTPSGVADDALRAGYYLFIKCRDNCDTTGLPSRP